MLAIKGNAAALNHIFTLAGTNLTADRVISRVFSSFERNCLIREIKPPKWNLAPVPKSFTCSLNKLLKLSFDKHLTWKHAFS